MKLHAPTREDCQTVREWRNRDISGLRTPYKLTELMQDNFYENVVSNPKSDHRYWSGYNHNVCAAFAGLTNIEWENGSAEISLIVDPQHRGESLGEMMIQLLLEVAFHSYRLYTVYGECYRCNPAVKFWEKQAFKLGAEVTELPRRKFWGGKLWDSFYFAFTKEAYDETRRTYSSVGSVAHDWLDSQGAIQSSSRDS